MARGFRRMITEEFVLDYVDPSNPVPDDEKDEDE